MAQDSLVQWLRSIHLFSGLTEEEAQAFLQECERLEVPSGHRFFTENDPDSHLYLVYKGEVLLWTWVEVKDERRPMSLGRCRKGDYFNVEAAVWGLPATCNARALVPTVVFRIPYTALAEWRKAHPDLDWLLRMVDRARERGRLRRPYWMTPEELLTIYTRPHRVVLYLRMWLSVVLVGVALAFLLWWAATPQFQSLLLGSGLAVLAAVAWAVYVYLEWRNDAIAITPLRAVKIERYVLVYEAREEVLLNMLVAQEVATGWFDRLWGMGDIVLRTEGPSTVLRHIPRPELVARVLEEYRDRWARLRLRDEYERMAAALRERLNIKPKEEETQAPPAEEEQPPPLSPWKAFWRRAFASRVEEGAVVTYYRHWFFLVWPLFWPFLLVLTLAILTFARALDLIQVFSLKTLGYVTLGGSALFLLYALWHYVEWRNDYYQITPDRVIDVKRFIIGREQRHTAPLEEVRSIDYEQPNLLARLLNFGNVFIYTGGDQPLVFTEVASPAQAQYDIFQRLSARQRQKLIEQWKQERERFLEWLAVYHDLAKEVFGAPPSPGPETRAGPSPGSEAPSPPPKRDEDDGWGLPPAAAPWT